MSNCVLSSSSLCGTDVKNSRGESLGEVKDLMIDTNTGRVSYAVVSFGGFLGFGDKLFAIPLEAMKLNKNDECLILDETKERLEQAPGFDKDDWPSAANPQWTNSVYDYYNVRPYSH
ncbi:MAG: PRC-barrel domain-containing protein [Gammaproteobacteria bacterium]|nr:PRC-barrel domain-containing protein [Gammaproteobacteria bacterium]